MFFTVQLLADHAREGLFCKMISQIQRKNSSPCPPIADAEINTAECVKALEAKMESVLQRIHYLEQVIGTPGFENEATMNELVDLCHLFNNQSHKRDLYRSIYEASDFAI